MPEWWTYRPSDFLMFSLRVYERLVESHNAAFLTWRWTALVAALGALALWRAKPEAGGRCALALAGAGLVFVAWTFLWNRYASINWAAAYAAPAFAIEGFALCALTLFSRNPLRPIGRDLSSGLAAALVALATFGYPLAAPLAGRPWNAAEVAGVTPDPTALLALGLTALLRRRGAALALAPIPLLWCSYAAVTLWTLGAPQAWAMTAGLALFAAAAAARLLRQRPAAGAA